jgi:hypothetical protein
VEQVIKVREGDHMMGVCEGKRKTKETKWGPVLVERQRRYQNQGDSMLQRATNLKKKKKNLEPVKGNRFASLQIEDLSQMANDINIRVGNSRGDKDRILNKLS